MDVTIVSQAKPPTEYEMLVKRIKDEYEGLSRSFQSIARYLTQNPNGVVIQSISDIAGRCNVHPSSLVRFAQNLGYKGLPPSPTFCATS